MKSGPASCAGAATGEVRSQLTGHTAWVASLSFLPTRPELASGATDKTARI